MTRQKNYKTAAISRRSGYLLIFAILILTALIYAASLKNGFVNWDDGKNVFENPDIQHLEWSNIRKFFSSFYLGMYQPLTTLSFAADFKLSGLNPFQFHLTNFILHLLNVWLVFLLITRLTKNTIAAVITSLFFAIHPLHAESVCWISERKDVLYTFFYLASVISWITFIKSGRKFYYYILSMILFLLALLSKSAAVTLPVIIILTDYYLGLKINIKNHFNKIPFFFLAIVFGIISIISQQVIDPASVSGIHYSVFNRIIFGLYAFSFYVVNTLFPLKLSALHPFPVKISPMPVIFYLYSILSLLFIALYFWLYRNHKFKRETKKDIYFGTWFFLISISLVIFIPVGQAVAAERYTYIPYIGLFFIAGSFFSKIYSNELTLKSSLRRFYWIILLILTVIFSYSTINRIPVWKDSYSLFTDIIAKYPSDAPVAYNNRSIDLKQKGKMQEALNDLNTALSIRPDYADAWSNRGLLFKDLGNYQQAATDLSKAISLSPKLYEPYYNRGLVYNIVGQFNSALQDFNMCVKINPANEVAYNDRGISKAQLGDPYGALSDFTTAININPSNSSSYLNRGITRLNLSDQIGSCADFQKASQLGSDKAGQYLMKFCK
jgi:Tfp pilus assembly protein PilF